jgi:hypothetical protein
MSAFGHFCAFCERPLPDESWVWNARTGECLEDNSCEIQDWDYLFLLDHNCHEAQKCARGIDPTILLLPTDENAFTPLQGFSQMHYSLQRMYRVLIDDTGQELEREDIERVVVRGTTERAQATIDYFALNTPYYRADQSEWVIPMQDYLSLEDRRMDQRTLAWKNAEMVAWDLRYADTIVLGQFATEQFRLLAGAMGFWSSCATATARVLGDRNTLRQIFFDAADSARGRLAIEGLGPDEAFVFRGSGPHHTFPGTQNIFV